MKEDKLIEQRLVVRRSDYTSTDQNRIKYSLIERRNEINPNSFVLLLWGTKLLPVFLLIYLFIFNPRLEYYMVFCLFHHFKQATKMMPKKKKGREQSQESVFLWQSVNWSICNGTSKPQALICRKL